MKMVTEDMLDSDDDLPSQLAKLSQYDNTPPPAKK